MAYAVRVERGSDDDVEAFGLPVERNRKRVLFSDYAREYAQRARHPEAGFAARPPPAYRG